ncbi:hypothetical protein ABBQ38_004604 [Trebouxia sp. C0009 RCD-2024]
MHRAQSSLIPHHNTIPAGGVGNSGEQKRAAEAFPAELQPTSEIVKQANAAGSSDGQTTHGLGLSEVLSNGKAGDCNLDAVQLAPAVATSESAAVRSGEPMAAGAGFSQGQSKRLSSGRCCALQKLKKVLAKKPWPCCMRVPHSDIPAPSLKQDKAMEGQQAAAASEQVVQHSSPAVRDDKGKRGSMQRLQARAGRCLQKVMPACIKPPAIHATPERQAEVQPLTAVAGPGGGQPDRGSQGKVASWSLALLKKKAMKGQQTASANGQVHLVADAADVGTVRKQQPTAEEGSGQKKRLGKVAGLFKRRKAASKGPH